MQDGARTEKRKRATMTWRRTMAQLAWWTRTSVSLRTSSRLSMKTTGSSCSVKVAVWSTTSCASCPTSSYRRSWPVTREIWIAIQELFAMHKAVQLGGVEERKKVIRFLLARKRYQFWYEAGRIQPGESLEESDMPDEWLAAHYGWGEPVGRQPYESDDEGSWSPSATGSVAIIEDTDIGASSSAHAPALPPPPVVTEEPGSTTDTPGVTAEPKAKSKGKCGGKGTTVLWSKDPPVEDDADGHVWKFVQGLGKIAWKPFTKGRVTNMTRCRNAHIYSNSLIWLFMQAFDCPSKTRARAALCYQTDSLWTYQLTQLFPVLVWSKSKAPVDVWTLESPRNPVDSHGAGYSRGRPNVVDSWLSWCDEVALSYRSSSQRVAQRRNNSKLGGPSTPVTSKGACSLQWNQRGTNKWLA